jgi:dTDP-4-dehydrorhamnose reductase
MIMKKILVTGSNGFLGRKITERFLRQQDFILIATGKGENRFPVNDGYTYFDLDITDAAAIRELIGLTRPDVVINTAALALPDQCEKEKELCARLNTAAVADLAAVCAELGIHLIHLSTDFVFDGSGGPYQEEDEPNPVSYYGLCKLAGEMAVKASGARWAIIRTVLVYGAAPGSGRSNIVLWVKSSLEKGLTIRVVADQWRTPTLAEDLADACITVAQQGAEGVFHISGNEQVSIFELALRVADYWKLNASLITPVPTASLNEAAHRPPVTGFIIEKAMRELQFKPHTIGKGLQLIDRQLKESL